MTQRIIEVSRTYFCYSEITVRTTVDLEHVQLFEESSKYGDLDPTHTHVYLQGKLEWILNIPYDDFKKLHQVYIDSKNPPQVIPKKPEYIPEYVPVFDCTHPPEKRKVAIQGFYYCSVCGKPLECAHPEDRVIFPENGLPYCTICGIHPYHKGHF
jgi:hypothetical protein